jgi:hypothetical protein
MGQSESGPTRRHVRRVPSLPSAYRLLGTDGTIRLNFCHARRSTSSWFRAPYRIRTSYLQRMDRPWILNPTYISALAEGRGTGCSSGVVVAPQQAT